MQQKRVSFVVGHEHWGKSRTLRALTNGDSYQRKITIGGVEFYVRRTSNDDFPERYVEFMNSRDPNTMPNLIASLCPKFEKLNNYDNTLKIADAVLRALRGKGYQLFFWVIEHRWGNPASVVTENEISELYRYGPVQVFSEIDAKDSVRAAELRTFVADVVLGPGI